MSSAGSRPSWPIDGSIRCDHGPIGLARSGSVGHLGAANSGSGLVVVANDGQTGAMVELSEGVQLLDEAAVGFATSRDLLVASGPDAASYLQGQLSQDVEGLRVGATTRTLLLQPQGKVDAWLRVHRPAPEVFWLDTDPGHGEAAAARLNRFKLRVDVTIEVTTVPVLAVRGARAAHVIEGLAGGVVALEAGWGGIAGLDLLHPDGALDVDAVAGTLGLPIGPPELAEVVRVLQGQPAMGTELDDSTIPAAAGIVGPSVDFTKGCYVGQELVARVDSRGNNTPTKLHLLRFAASTAPSIGADLHLDDAVVGTVTSAAYVPGRGVVGLGYLKRSVEAPTTLQVDGSAVEVSALPS